MIFGFGKRRREEEQRERKKLVEELESEQEALRTELGLLTKKLNVELQDKSGDRTTTLSRYPRRIVELKIKIDQLGRKLKRLQAQ
ncbi:MAG TPA: hypothetical protein EYN79_06610 [Planctomycetes bacterium]|nr:hypothetical protein [Planctomycetota bacterium]HIN80129.1 hypothetical protein [Planctomycetota bacterium]